ncbi:peptidoglycan-binding protein [Candidatus Saccharibacteria bacterium]|nr:peptidoglycan-binding protein [Candidatus Saccharibacteria bacterium]
MKESTGLSIGGVILTTIICFLVLALIVFCAFAAIRPDIFPARLSPSENNTAEVAVASPDQLSVPLFVTAASPTPAPTPTPAVVIVDQPVFIPGQYGTGATAGVSPYEPADPRATSSDAVPVFVPSSPFPASNAYDYLTVIDIQNALSRNGYTVSVDGGYGPETATQVRQFQNAKKLGSVDGVTGPETAGALGITLAVSRNYHYEADLASIAAASPSDYLYYIATYNGATLTQFHRENGIWIRVWTTPISFTLSTDLSATNSLGVHVLPSGFPTGLFALDATYANALSGACPSGTQLVIDDRNFT